MKVGTLTSRAVTLVHRNGFFGKQVVTCSAHSMEHFKTGGGGGGGAEGRQTPSTGLRHPSFKVPDTACEDA